MIGHLECLCPGSLLFKMIGNPNILTDLPGNVQRIEFTIETIGYNVWLRLVRDTCAIALVIVLSVTVYVDCI